MNKKIIIPAIIAVLIVIVAFVMCSGKNKIKLEWQKVESSVNTNDSIDLRVYVENSGSMDAYMCAGSNLKDAVFDYISDLKKFSNNCSLFYINSKEIPYRGDLQSFIKDLTPREFAKAGGNRANTDLRQIFQIIMQNHGENSVTVFVSDCILDIPQSATAFFGNCQVSMKNTFNEALAKNPNLGVEIMKLDSKFDGYWYCGQNSKLLSDVKRPYYIWVIGNKDKLAFLNKNVPVDNIIGGIKEYCAFAGKQPIPFDIDKDTYVINHTGKIEIQLLADLTHSLQSELIIKNIVQYKATNPESTSINSVEKITNPSSKYSHVVNISVSNPETVKSETITFNYPYLASWVEASNDSTGTDIENNMDKTTGILYLIKGVAEAYKSSTDFGTMTFNLKNK